MQIEVLAVTPFMQNCRIVSAAGSDALVIDPGGEAQRIQQALAQRGLNCTQIWLTHSHIDHCGGVAELQRASGAKLFAHPAERSFRENVASVCRMYGLDGEQMVDCPEPDVELRGGESLPFAGAEFKVLFTPGHSPGHLSFYCAEHGLILSGDVLFAGSIGRTDLPGGDHKQLLRSIKQLVSELPPQTKVLSGHGPDTTIAAESDTNPYVHEALGM